MGDINKKILIIFFLLALAVRWHFNLPVSRTQAIETYTAYSLLQTGKDTNNKPWPLFFRGHDDYPTTLAVYSRIPYVALFGLNKTSVFLPSILAGNASIILFMMWLLTLKDFSTGWFKYGVGIFLIFSPGFIFMSLFNLAESLALCFVFGGLLLVRDIKKSWEIKTFLALTFFILAFFSSVFSLPFILVLITKLSNLDKKLKKTFLLTLIILGILFFLGNKNFKLNFVKTSVLETLNPSSYSYTVDRRLAYDIVTNNQINLFSHNLNRIVHNKFFYTLNGLFTTITAQFDLEQLLSPMQSETILDQNKDNYLLLPMIIYLEVPFAFAGLIILLKNRSKIIWLGIGGILSAILFSKTSLSQIYIFPFILVSELVLLFWLFKKIKSKTFNYTMILSFCLIWIMFLITFFALLLYHPKVWATRSDYLNFEIWNYLVDKTDNYQQIVVSERLGNPVDYLLYYLKYPPALYQQSRVDYLSRTSRFDSMDKIGKFNFGAFKYLESDRKPHQFWVGLAGEFVGKYMPYQDIEQVVDGQIKYKIKGFKNNDVYWGNELWFVETKFN